jgi:hypothetical protein
MDSTVREFSLRSKNKVLGAILGSTILLLIAGSIAYIIWFKAAQ